MENIIDTTIIVKNFDVSSIEKIVLKAVSKDKIRESLCNVFIQVDGENYTATATNGYFMQVMGTPLGNGYQSVVIPVFAFKDLKKKGVKTCELRFSEHSDIIDFVVDSKVIYQTLKVDTIYPNYAVCIPQNFDKEVTFQAGEMVEALNNLKDVVSGQHKKVSLICMRDQIRVANECPSDLSYEEMKDYNYKKERVTCVANEEGSICFNFDLLKKVLARFAKKEWITLKFNHSLSASIWERKNDNFTTLLMPVRV